MSHEKEAKKPYLMTPQTEFRYDFLKDAYYFQIERLEGIRERIAFIGGHLLVLGGGIAYLPLHYEIQKACLADLYFGLMLFFAFVAFACSVYLTIYALARGFRYATIPSPLALYEHVDKITDWNTKVAEPQRLDVEEEMKRQLARQFATCADHNLRLNTLRSDMLVSATKAAICSSLFLLLASPVFIWSEAHKPEKPTVVSIPEPIKLKP